MQILHKVGHTIHTINLYKELRDRAISLRSSPVKSCCIFANAGEGDIGSVGDLDSEDMDKLGDWLSED